MKKQNYWIGLGDILSTLFGWLFRYTRNTNQSTSGRAFEKYLEGSGSARKLINLAFFWQDDHCKAAWIADEKRAKEDVLLKKKVREENPKEF